MISMIGHSAASGWGLYELPEKRAGRLLRARLGLGWRSSACLLARGHGAGDLALKPIRRFTREMEQLRRGEFEVGGDLGPAGDFKEMAAELQLLGQQLQADRLKMLGEKAPCSTSSISWKTD